MDDVERLGYHQKWIEYGILDPADIQPQLATLATDPNTEHCRYATARSFMSSRVNWSDSDVDHLIEVAQLDPNRTMSGSIMAELLAHSGLTDAQFTRVSRKSRAWGGWIEKIVSRYAILRRMSAEPWSSGTRNAVCASGDAGLQRIILNRKLAHRELLEQLAQGGATKEIRHLARAQLNSEP